MADVTRREEDEESRREYFRRRAEALANPEPGVEEGDWMDYIAPLRAVGNAAKAARAGGNMAIRAMRESGKPDSKKQDINFQARYNKYRDSLPPEEKLKVSQDSFMKMEKAAQQEAQKAAEKLAQRKFQEYKDIQSGVKRPDPSKAKTAESISYPRTSSKLQDGSSTSYTDPFKDPTLKPRK